jgi:ankyrin repeat protein
MSVQDPASKLSITGGAISGEANCTDTGHQTDDHSDRCGSTDKAEQLMGSEPVPDNGRMHARVRFAETSSEQQLPPVRDAGDQNEDGGEEQDVDEEDGDYIPVECDTNEVEAGGGDHNGDDNSDSDDRDVNDDVDDDDDGDDGEDDVVDDDDDDCDDSDNDVDDKDSGEGSHVENDCADGGNALDKDAAAALATTFSSLPKGLLGSLLSQGKLGSKPLHTAAAVNDAARLQALLAADGELRGCVDDTDAFDYTALHIACEAGADAAVAALLACGADHEARTRMHASRPLHYACFEGRVGACRLLLCAGADVNPRTDDLRTPLFQAAFRGHASCVRELLKAGADPAVQTRDGRVAVDVAPTDEIRDLLQQPAQKMARTQAVERLSI